MSYEQCQWAEAAPHWRLEQNVIDAAINEWRKQLRACVHANGQHFEHLLRARVTNKSYGQLKYKKLKKMLLYCWTCHFRGLKVSQGKVHTINRWGGISNHLSMAYLLSNTCTKNYWNRTTVVESLVVGWYPCLRHSVDRYIWSPSPASAPNKLINTEWMLCCHVINFIYLPPTTQSMTFLFQEVLPEITVVYEAHTLCLGCDWRRQSSVAHMNPVPH